MPPAAVWCRCGYHPGRIASSWPCRLRTAFERGGEVDANSGSGLGLAVVDQIAEVHHARVSLEMRQGGSGLEAVVSFPILRTAA